MDDRAHEERLEGRVRDAAPLGRDLQAAHWHANVASRLFGTTVAPPRIGRYRVIARLGEGASGVVWSAIDPELDRRVAIKLLHARASGDEGDALVREAKALARLSHPNVVPVYDAGEHDGQVFVTLELVEGRTMRQWLATQPQWREIVEVFAQAAHGLHAAHCAGIVHRDVKPENILIGADGRVRVSDFGIARAFGRDEPHALTRSNTASSNAGVGTPAYMAPEQFLCDAEQARTDQFGLCVALHEALYGERPFQGRDRMALAAAVTAGRRRPPPEGAAVPRWLERVVARGLQTTPAARFPDMAALARELERGHRRRRWTWLPLLGVGLAAAGVAMAATTPARPGCNERDDRLAQVWNPEVAQQIHAAFAATGLAYADERSGQLAAAFDRFALAWREAHAQACNEHGLDDAVALAQQYCLHTRLLELSSLTAAFTRADAGVVEHAAIGGRALRAPAECLYAAPSAPAHDPAQDLELRAAIARARALGDVGKLVDGLAAAHAAVEQARTLGDRSLESEALLAQAELENPLVGSRVEVDPVATMHAAVLSAEAARRGDLLAIAMVMSVEAGVFRGDYDGALALAPRAREAVAALGDPPELLGRVELALGELSTMQRDDGDALSALERARVAFERSGASSRRWLAQTYNLLGETHFRHDEYDDARRDYQQAVAMAIAELGSRHVMVANATGNLAETYFLAGDLDTAERHFADALTIRREIFGEDSVWVIHSIAHLGDIALERGDASAALRHYRDALARHERQPRLEQAPAPEDEVANVFRDLQIWLQTAWLRNGAAAALLELGQLDEALAEADAVADVGLPDDVQHPDLTRRIDMRGQVLLAQGHVDEAADALAAALARLERRYGSAARPLVFALVGLGRARLLQGRVAEGRASIARALDILSPTPGAHARLREQARAALAGLDAVPAEPPVVSPRG